MPHRPRILELFEHSHAPDADGKLDEPSWTMAPAAPLLNPLPQGAPPPSVRTSFSMGPHELALALYDIPDDTTTTVLIDPTGAMQQWWMLTSEPGNAIKLQRCSFDGKAMEHDDRWEPKAAPCIELPAKGIAARSNGVLEAVIPWSRMERPTSWMKLHVSAHSKTNAGAWGHRPSTKMNPYAGFRFSRAGLWPKITMKADLITRSITTTLKGPLAIPGTTWRWTLWQRGRVIDGGFRDIGSDGMASATMHWPALENLVLVWQATDTPGLLLPAAIKRIPRPLTSFALSTPVSNGTVSIAYELSTPVAETTIRIRDPSGNELATGTVKLPAGRGGITFSTQEAWGSPFTIEIDALMRSKAVVMVQGVEQ